MFDFIRKPMVWDAWNRRLDSEIGKHREFHLKTIQDLVMFGQLRGTSSKSIAEIGGGNSRLLPVLAKANTCVNVEKFEGIAGGPSREKRFSKVRNVHAYLGENDPQLGAATYDIVFSVSVVEHVPTDQLAAFHADQMRILKPGGIFLHAIDIYLEDQPPPHVLKRFETYKSWVTGEASVEPLGEIYAGPCRFTCDLASNPDNVMFAWRSVAPKLDEMRQRAQSASLLVGGRKR